MPLVLTAAQDDDGRRLDRILRIYMEKTVPDLPLSAIYRLIRMGKVLVDGKKAGADSRVKTGQVIEIKNIQKNDVDLSEKQEISSIKQPDIQSNNKIFPLCILFEGNGLLILNKPAGIAVHGEHSLEEQVVSYLSPGLPESISFRPGPLHRLDRMTSGIIVFSKNLDGARSFSSLLRERKVVKQYLAVVDGLIGKKETWGDLLVRDKNLRKTFTSDSNNCNKHNQGKSAESVVTPLASDGGRSLILVEIKTGRTHQIRAQAAARGRPLSGDKKYGGLPIENITGGGYMLHAYRLGFPDANGKPLVITAPPFAKNVLWDKFIPCLSSIPKTNTAL